LKNWLYQAERQTNLGCTAAIAEAEGASEREAALALKRDVVSTYWAWGSDGFLKNRSEMMRTINCNRVTSNLWQYR
jgi:Iap family predicted aminopeptidase